MRKPVWMQVMALSVLSLSAGLPGWTWFLQGGSTPAGSGDDPAGLLFLSLPCGLAGLRDPLAGWDAFPEDSMPPLVPPLPLEQQAPPLPDADAGTDTFPVELFGEVHEGEQRVYCFLDTRTNRWFRLPLGGTDQEAQVSLIGGSGVDQPQLMDLQTGRRYQLKMGRQQAVVDGRNPEGVVQ